MVFIWFFIWFISLNMENNGSLIWFWGGLRME